MACNRYLTGRVVGIGTEKLGRRVSKGFFPRATLRPSPPGSDLFPNAMLRKYTKFRRLLIQLFPPLCCALSLFEDDDGCGVDKDDWGSAVFRNPLVVNGARSISSVNRTRQWFFWTCPEGWYTDRDRCRQSTLGGLANMVCLVVRVGSFDGVKVMFCYTTIFDVSIKELFPLPIIAYCLTNCCSTLVRSACSRVSISFWICATRSPAPLINASVPFGVSLLFFLAVSIAFFSELIVSVMAHRRHWKSVKVSTFVYRLKQSSKVHDIC